jgi:hypothetical protein
MSKDEDDADDRKLVDEVKNWQDLHDDNKTCM